MQTAGAFRARNTEIFTGEKKATSLQTHFQISIIHICTFDVAASREKPEKFPEIFRGCGGGDCIYWESVPGTTKIGDWYHIYMHIYIRVSGDIVNCLLITRLFNYFYKY